MCRWIYVFKENVCCGNMDRVVESGFMYNVRNIDDLLNSGTSGG